MMSIQKLAAENSCKLKIQSPYVDKNAGGPCATPPKCSRILRTVLENHLTKLLTILFADV